MTPKAIQDLLDELEASRRSRKRAWENLQELRWVLKDGLYFRTASCSRLSSPWQKSRESQASRRIISRTSSPRPNKTKGDCLPFDRQLEFPNDSRQIVPAIQQRPEYPGRYLFYSTVVQSNVGLLIQTRRIDQPIQGLGVRPEGQRPTLAPLVT